MGYCLALVAAATDVHAVKRGPAQEQSRTCANEGILKYQMAITCDRCLLRASIDTATWKKRCFVDERTNGTSSHSAGSRARLPSRSRQL
eukprot:6206086-Pleurochrysis_carterae.AAC.1